jgi:hypothetical protein
MAIELKQDAARCKREALSSSDESSDDTKEVKHVAAVKDEPLVSCTTLVVAPATSSVVVVVPTTKRQSPDQDGTGSVPSVVKVRRRVPIGICPACWQRASMPKGTAGGPVHSRDGRCLKGDVPSVVQAAIDAALLG